ncbi:MAG: nicotinate-nucleotide--dimethylbenzimidazole phosphoribosyltransferase [Cohaesibacter sp.]|nr:nicotinate-nucleotide--dimethylbenzimidazole phosphoribosyltransferase [Cohaesibacter sp.]
MTTSATGMPFDDILALIGQMSGPDEDARAKVRARDAVLTKPAGSLGRLEELAEWVAVWQRQAPPKIFRPLVAVFAGNHGVAAQGVSAYPPSVTQQMVENFAAGGAAVNQLCIAHDLGLKVFDLALDYPTGDITQEAAMDEVGCAKTIAFGMEAIAGGTDLLCIGEMGIANTTIASVIYAALFGGSAAEWCGRGTGVDDDGLTRKAEAVEAALALHAGNLDKPLEVLRRLGGREIAAMVGAILAARLQNIPVIVDGFVASSAAAVLYALDKSAIDHCLFAHVSAESAHKKALDAMGVRALFDMGMRLGEGSGAALAAGVVKAAVQVHEGMATFEQAAVDGPAG